MTDSRIRDVRTDLRSNNAYLSTIHNAPTNQGHQENEMLWNGGMLGLGLANFDGSIAVPALVGLVVSCVVAWALNESTGVWNAFLED